MPSMEAAASSSNSKLPAILVILWFSVCVVLAHLEKCVFSAQLASCVHMKNTLMTVSSVCLKLAKSGIFYLERKHIAGGRPVLYWVTFPSDLLFQFIEMCWILFLFFKLFLKYFITAVTPCFYVQHASDIFVFIKHFIDHCLFLSHPENLAS